MKYTLLKTTSFIGLLILCGAGISLIEYGVDGSFIDWLRDTAGLFILYFFIKGMEDL